MSDEREPVRGFMCRIDWGHELGSEVSGSRVYPSEDDLRRNHSCADACGIVEVEVRLVRVVVEGERP